MTRVLIAAAALVLGAVDAARAVNRSWNGGPGNWSTAGNWTPVGPPAAGDVAYIGNFVGVTDDEVLLDVNEVIAGLHISNGMMLDTDGSTLDVNGDITITGDNSSLVIEEAVAGDDAEVENVTIGGTSFLHLDEGTLRVEDQMIIGSDASLRGGGLVHLEGTGTTLVNNGSILTGSGVKMILQDNFGEFDLDGLTGDGLINISGVSTAWLSIAHGALSDPFSGQLNLGHHSRLVMNIPGGWEADASSNIAVFSPNATAWLAGTEATFAGPISVSHENTLFEVDADVVFEPTSSMAIGAGNRVEFFAPHQVTINGGNFLVQDGAQMDFHGTTTIHGGTFTTAGVEDADGDVDFNGATTWSGNVTINGRAQQNGDATASAPTVINAQLFDFSGDDGLTNWDVNAPLVINTVENKTHPFDFFHGVMNIGGGVLNRFTLNFIDNDELGWVMDGELNLAGSEFFFINRIAGARVVNGGEINISDSKVEISADMNFMPWGVANFAAPGSELRMRGRSWITEGATFNGEGTLHNAIGGEMVLYHGASLDDVGLVNQGDLHLSDDFWLTTAGLVAVDRFTNDDDGTLHVRLGGYALGAEYSHLLVNGGEASLDGLLEVLLIDDGDGLFLPQLGDEFSILTAIGGVTGQFDNSPVSLAGGKQFHWSVLYNPFDVRLRLDEIVVPEPQTLLLAVLGAVAALVHRHGKGEHTMAAAPRVASAC